MYLVTVELICYLLYSWSMCDICAKNGRKNLRRTFRKYICCSAVDNAKGEPQVQCNHGGKRYALESMLEEDIDIHSGEKPLSRLSATLKFGNPSKAEDMIANKLLRKEVSHHISCPNLNSKSLNNINLSSLLLKTICRSVSQDNVMKYDDKTQLWSSEESIRSFKMCDKINDFLIHAKDKGEFDVGEQNGSETKQTQVDADDGSKPNEVAKLPVTVIYENNITEGVDRNQDSCEFFRSDVFQIQYLKKLSENKKSEVACLQTDPNFREPYNGLSRIIQVRELHSEVNWLSNQGEKIYKHFQKLQDSISQIDNLLLKVERNWTSICNKHRRFSRTSVLIECRSKVASRKENQLMVKSSIVTQEANSEISLALEEQRHWMSLTKSVGELEAAFKHKTREKPSIKRAQSESVIEKIEVFNVIGGGTASTRSLVDERKHKDYRWDSLISVTVRKDNTKSINAQKELKNERKPVNWVENGLKTNLPSPEGHQEPRKLITWKEIYFRNKGMNA
ncbi:uncharacterized protein LOC124169554 [Ischnura elegans]|uniref:uncharacterized protein LOC124169554 n=1 Tax=Ischnura elegans TaxID=197161 RepID=UPI001ED87D02|nr:uncharacterized protein LOC124169554 [Ischnura elegans]